MNVTAGGAGRALLWIAFVVWSISLMSAPMTAASASFLHMINLPFHEAGHILFGPFGDFMSTLGGSLTQVLVPLVCLVAFLTTRLG